MAIRDCCRDIHVVERAMQPRLPIVVHPLPRVSRPRARRRRCALGSAQGGSGLRRRQRLCGPGRALLGNLCEPALDLLLARLEFPDGFRIVARDLLLVRLELLEGSLQIRKVARHRLQQLRLIGKRGGCRRGLLRCSLSQGRRLRWRWWRCLRRSGLRCGHLEGRWDGLRGRRQVFRR